MSSQVFAGRAMLVLACMAFLGGRCVGEEPAPAHGHAVADHGAADHAHEDGHHSHTIHGEKPKNYFGPKTEFLYWSPQLFIWTMLLFLPLWYVLTKFVWGPMMRGIEGRDRRMAESLAMAKRLREEAKSMTFEQDAEGIRAQQEARTILDKARADATAEVNEILAHAREESTQNQRAARQEIEDAAQAGLREIESAAESLGEGIARKLILQSGGSS